MGDIVWQHPAGGAILHAVEAVRCEECCKPHTSLCRCCPDLSVVVLFRAGCCWAVPGDCCCVHGQARCDAVGLCKIAPPGMHGDGVIPSLMSAPVTDAVHL